MYLQDQPKHCQLTAILFGCGNTHSQFAEIHQDLSLLRSPTHRNSLRRKHDWTEPTTETGSVASRVLENKASQGKISVSEKRKSLELMKQLRQNKTSSNKDRNQNKQATTSNKQEEVFEEYFTNCQIQQHQIKSKARHAVQRGSVRVVFQNSQNSGNEYNLSNRSNAIHFSDRKIEENALIFQTKLKENEEPIRIPKGHPMRLGENLPTYRSVFDHSNGIRTERSQVIHF